MRMKVVVAIGLTALALLSSTVPAGGVEVVAAGDIASSGPGDTVTSNRVLALDPTLVFTLGDNAYPDGTRAQYDRYYDPTWGRFRSLTRPSPGNHDWRTAGAAGYEGYFGVRAGRIRSFVAGSWRVISLDSSVNLQTQDAALASALAADDHLCELLFFHHPRWSSGEHGNDPRMGAWWETAYEHGVDVILNGHDHDYERFAPKGPSGATVADGITQFVVGMGGAATRPFGKVRPGSQVRITGNANWGVLAIDLLATSYAWRFVDADSGATRDSGSSDCHS